jgi:uracil-DNA glycosylase family 4
MAPQADRSSILLVHDPRPLRRIGIDLLDPKSAYARCDGCPFPSQCVVRGHGPDEADRVIVGQAPAKQEVLMGIPFVGDAGRRLDKALLAAQIDRASLYITNAVGCQPPNDQSPPPQEALEACHDRLIAQVRRRAPRKVLALGRTAAKALTGRTVVISEARLRDLPLNYLDNNTKVRVTYHPSSLPRNPEWPERFDEDVRWLS